MSDEIEITLDCCAPECHTDALWCIMFWVTGTPHQYMVRYVCSYHMPMYLARNDVNEVKYLGPTYSEIEGKLTNIKYEYDRKMLSDG